MGIKFHFFFLFNQFLSHLNRTLPNQKIGPLNYILNIYKHLITKSILKPITDKQFDNLFLFILIQLYYISIIYFIYY